MSSAVNKTREENVYENVAVVVGGGAKSSAGAAPTANNDNGSSSIPPDVVVATLERMVMELESAEGRLSLAREAAAGATSASSLDMIDVIRHVFPIVVDVQVETLKNCMTKSGGGSGSSWKVPPATADGLCEFLCRASELESSGTDSDDETSSRIRFLRSRIRAVYMP